MAPLAEKALRRDAARNRERLIASAREVFAARGVDVPVEEITHHAGLGMGTLYRHFPTKEDLIEAVLETAFAEIFSVAEEAAAAEDAWTGFTGFVGRVLDLHAQHRGVKDLLSVRHRGAEHARRMRSRLRPILTRLVERAHEQGSLRKDFAAEDLSLLFWSAGAVIEATSSVAPDQRSRFVALLLDGLRAPGATSLPGRPLTHAQIARIRQRGA